MKFYVNNLKEHLQYFVTVEFVAYDDSNRKFKLTMAKNYYTKFVNPLEQIDSSKLETFAFDWCETYEEYTSICRAQIYQDLQVESLFNTNNRAYHNISFWIDVQPKKSNISTNQFFKVYNLSPETINEQNALIANEGYDVKQFEIHNSYMFVLYEKRK